MPSVSNIQRLGMIFKICYKCNQKKDETLFKKDYRKHCKTKYSNQCLECCTKVYKIWRTKNKDYYNQKFRERRLARKQRAIELKGGKCTKCQLVVHPAAFDFHHLDPTQKDFDIGLMMSHSDEHIFQELEKCVLLCANCHRTEHFINGY